MKWVISVACALLIFVSTIYVRQPAPSPESQIVEEEVEQTAETTTTPKNEGKSETTEFVPRLERPPTSMQETEPPKSQVETTRIEPTATTNATKEETTTKVSIKLEKLETIATIGTLPTLTMIGDRDLETTTTSPSKTAPETTKATTTSPMTTTTIPSTTEQTTKAETTTKSYGVKAQSVDEKKEDAVGSKIGNFRITGYTAEEGFVYGATTASGMGCRPGICAMNDRRRKELGIKYGDKIYVEGLGIFTVADCGCGYNTVDIWCYTNAEAGRITGYADVYYA